MRPPGFGVYVHWPYCAAKCPYCDFNSHVRTQVDGEGWVAAITRELSFVASLLAPPRPQVDSIFFGGGTPSLIGGSAVGAVLESISQLWPMADDVEITLEANPSSADIGRFRDYRAAGVNRLSLGVQSLDDRALGFLGRLHNSAEALAAVEAARAVFDRFSIDLIYARPGQDAKAWSAELNQALKLGAPHFSLYQLTIEEGTPFAVQQRAGRLVVPPEDAAASLYELTQDIMDEAGLPAYEISNHSRPGDECRHNLIYWRYGCYAGVGPGAHGRLPHGASRMATFAERQPERWLSRVGRDCHGFEAMTPLTEEDAAREHLLMNLRLAEGIDVDAYLAQWGVEIDAGRVASLTAEQLVGMRGRRLVVTGKGRLVLNAIIAELAN